jgi:cell wall-associated NlpC family hydrolase
LPDEVSQCQQLAGTRALPAAADRADSSRETMKNRKELLAMAAMAVLVAALTPACASSGAARPRPFPMPAGSATPPPVATAEPVPVTPPAPQAAVPAEATLIDTALSFRGTRYRDGGSDPSGFDCSGFTQWVFAQYGVALPREVTDQFTVGKKIRKEDDLKPGDLVFFHTVSRGASHVGIYVADDQFVHAPSSKGVVRVEHLSSSYWSPRFVGGRRLDPEPRQAEPAVARRRPSGGESTVASAAAARSGVRDSKAAD